ncbi:MAG: hypothetical protein Tsb0020_27360 [Haliangiales bacterium]
MTQTRDQVRASHAYACVDRARAMPSKERQSYRSQVNDLGATIMRNGLVAALAFIRRRGDEAAIALLADLAGYDTHGLGQKDDVEKFIAAVRELDVDQYMLATRDLLALAVWLRRAIVGLGDSGGSAAGAASEGGGDHA